MNRFAKLRRALLAVSPDETTAYKRGFTISDDTQRSRLETIGRSFLSGYHAALEERTIAAIEPRLNAVDLEYRGFAFEGAGMAFGLLDLMAPWSGSRIEAFLRGPGDPHAYMIHVGVGWAFARFRFGRFRFGMTRVFNALDPVLRWLAMDGYGFHEGYFHGGGEVGRARPGRVGGYAARAFDQGLGRSLWFVAGSDPARIHAAMSRFENTRHSDLWSGVGLACAY